MRSAAAPTRGITSTATITDRDTEYAKKDPARTGIPSGWTYPSASAADSATDVRYGPRKTVSTLVE
ncbi:hypothetical protein SVIOM74S_09827 [Streptomyces violarus]